MAEKIKRFIECYVPVTCCNLKCEYCYVPQKHWQQGRMPQFKYTPAQIGRAFSRARWGGLCYVSICGGGETLLPPEMPTIVHEILKQDHFVNLTTNGTCTQAFETILKLIPPEMLERLHFAFSLHYLELKRLNLLSVFAENVARMRRAGCSFVVQLNLYDGYLPYLDEIKDYCLKHFKALPQLAATRDEKQPRLKLLTSLSEDEYLRLGRQFESPLFDFTMQNFNRRHSEFCHAGAWTFVADLAEGWIKPCYCTGEMIDFIQDTDKPIPFCPVGRNCRSDFCHNSSHFLSLGNIPEKFTEITYAGLRNRPEANWYTSRMSQFLSTKLQDDNARLSSMGKLFYSQRTILFDLTRRAANKLSRLLFHREIFRSRFSNYSR
ncbi:MAG: radical SAM protein [Kiritimatiellae bacterium]|nr:radical SAM protein [Kiritimatiellia bacterium]